MRTELQITNRKIPLILITGLTFGVILTFTDFSELTTAGLIIYGIGSFGVLFYGLFFVKQDLLKGLIIFLTGLLSLLGIISALFLWPYAIELRWLMALPLLGFLFLWIKRKLTYQEIGLLLLLNLDLAMKIAQIFN